MKFGSLHKREAWHNRGSLHDQTSPSGQSTKMNIIDKTPNGLSRSDHPAAINSPSPRVKRKSKINGIINVFNSGKVTEKALPRRGSMHELRELEKEPQLSATIRKRLQQWKNYDTINSSSRFGGSNCSSNCSMNSTSSLFEDDSFAESDSDFFKPDKESFKRSETVYKEKHKRSQTVSERFPMPGESLQEKKLGSLKVPFDKVYTLGDSIGTGFYGTVYKAHHVSLDESAQVAVKVVERLLKSDDDGVIEEAQILRDLRTLPHIVQIFDFYIDDESLYVVQELAAGGDVFDRLLEKKKYTENDARDLAILLLNTVQSLHDRKLVHRDLKPENLLLKSKKSDSNILLCDFGYAKYLPSDGVTGLLTQCGTPAFSAPEVIAGVEYWEEVDMWSTGCILFMLLGGHKPFDNDGGEPDAELIVSISAVNYNFDAPAWNTVSEEAKDLISNLLIKDQRQRFSAKESLGHPWFQTSSIKLKTTDLRKSLNGIKDYCETRTTDFHYIDESYTGENDLQYKTPKKSANSESHDSTNNEKKIGGTAVRGSSGGPIPPPGKSLEVEPLGSFKVPFHKVYKLGVVINSGFYGEVFKAHHVSTNEKSPVAVKVVSRFSESNTRDIMDEVQILKDIRSLPNVVKIFDFYTDDESLFMVQEYAGGGDVFDRLLEKKKYTENDARDLALHLLTTVQTLHDRKLVHRDIKPENLLLKSKKSDSNILLCDFGYAKYLPWNGDGLWTQCGTPAFAAPEIVSGVEYWEEVDMWSTGCVLFMILAGTQPFSHRADSELIDCISAADYSFNDSAWDTVSEEAKDLISKLLILGIGERLSASEALEHEWFQTSSKTLKSNFLTKAVQGIKHYCDNIRPAGEHFIDEEYTGEDDSRYTENIQKVENEHQPKVIGTPQPGDSLKVEPLGQLSVPFDEIYKLGKMVDNGSFIIRFEAHHTLATEDPVHVKVFDQDTEDIESILNDVSILKGLQHIPNILQLCDFYMDTKKIYMVHQRTGKDVIDRLLEKNIYEENEARDLAKNLLIAINYIHEKKLLHRNLKLDNLMLKSDDNDSEILIGGFGYAKYLPGGSDTGSGLWTRCGTPAFVAPEILEGIEYWEEVDMWSFGCIVFTLLGGYNPFAGENEIETYQYIATADYGFDENSWDDVSGDAKSFISKLLVVDRTERLTASAALEHKWFTNPSLAASKIPWVGDSLKSEPLGSLKVPFHTVYKIGDFILEGSFGVKHKAHHLSCGDTDEAIVKIIDRKGEYADSCTHEASILRGLGDSNFVIKLRDFYMDDKKIYAVYENMIGVDVFERLSENKRYSEGDARDLAKNLLKAVQSIHTRKLVHRNLKPENLILKHADSYSDIVLGGFTLAKYLPTGEDKGTGLFTFCGTPDYTAPEIVDGMEYFAEVDMWSIGCILYLLLSGNLPFEGKSKYETYELISAGHYDFHGHYWKFISQEAISLIKKMLVLNRKKRITVSKALESSWFSKSLKSSKRSSI